MIDLEGMSRHDLLAHLPPPDAAPIIGKLAVHGWETFRQRYAHQTPVDERGVVDYDTFIDTVLGEVDPDYRWQAPMFDQHHLQWRAARYHHGQFSESTIPNRFRDLPIHTIWTPRGFHIFVHAITHEPPVPSVDVMEEDVTDFGTICKLYSQTDEAIKLEDYLSGAAPLPDGRLIRFTGGKFRTYTSAQYEKARQDLIDDIGEQLEDGIPARFTKLTTVKFDKITSLETSLRRVRRGLADIAMRPNLTPRRRRTDRRRGRPVKLEVDLAA